MLVSIKGFIQDFNVYLIENKVFDKAKCDVKGLSKPYYLEESQKVNSNLKW